MLYAFMVQDSDVYKGVSDIMPLLFIEMFLDYIMHAWSY